MQKTLNARIGVKKNVHVTPSDLLRGSRRFSPRPRPALVPARIARIFQTRTEALINTGALARCKNASGTGELFQQFVTSSGKPLKRLTHGGISLHRAKAPALSEKFFEHVG